MMRTFGNGGLFGYYGMFSAAEYGPINCQLTSMKNVVIIETKTLLYAISPENVQDLVQTLGVKPDLTESTQPQKKKIRPARSMILILPVALYLVTIILLFITYRSLPDRIAVHFDALGNPDRWGSKVSYLISGLIPSTILFGLNYGVFLIMRKTSHDPALPTFIVIMVSFIQSFTLYINLDMYWVNRYDHHILPMFFVLIAFGGIMMVMLYVYYRIAVKRRKKA
jgi:uncharacterized membrane protein